jgi:hypothetical protein
MIDEFVASVGGFQLDRSPSAKRASATQRYAMNAMPRSALKTVAGIRAAARKIAPASAQGRCEEF